MGLRARNGDERRGTCGRIGQSIRALADGGKIRDHAITTTWTAFDEWQWAVTGGATVPVGAEASDALTGLFKAWLGALSATTNTPPRG